MINNTNFDYRVVSKNFTIADLRPFEVFQIFEDINNYITNAKDKSDFEERPDYYIYDDIYYGNGSCIDNLDANTAKVIEACITDKAKVFNLKTRKWMHLKINTRVVPVKSELVIYD